MLAVKKCWFVQSWSCWLDVLVLVLHGGYDYGAGTILSHALLVYALDRSLHTKIHSGR